MLPSLRLAGRMLSCPPPVRWLTCLALAALAADAQGQVFVEQVSPPSLARGGAARLTLRGSELDYAVGLWTSLPPGSLSAMPAGSNDAAQAQFDVQVSPHAPLGLYGLRLATASGLSNVHLFLIDDLPALDETEGPTASDPPQPLSLPVAVAGVCHESDVDRYLIDVTAGRRLTIEVVGSRLGQDLDPLVTVYDPHGREVALRDNDVGLGFDCRFEHVFAESGTHMVEVRDARYKGSEFCSYVLRIGDFPVARVALPSTVNAGSARLAFPQLGADTLDLAVAADQPLGSFFVGLRRPQDQASVWLPVELSELPVVLEQEPNNSADLASAAGAPAVLEGVLGTTSDRDHFAFELPEGSRWTVKVESRALGSAADLEVVLSDPSGKEMQRVDTEVMGEAAFEFAAAAAGRHVLLVRELTRQGGPEFTYRIKVRPREPRLELDSASDNLAIPQGTYQPLPLSLRRTDFDSPIELALLGAPPGMTLRWGTVPAGTAEFNDAIAVDASVPAGLYTLQVIGRGTAGDRPVTAVAQTRPLVDRLPTGRGPHGEPFELREDQRRLPPSLTDRLAVLVTPPSPFTFELSDSLVVLPRYDRVEFGLQTERSGEFSSPITFVARGGTLEKLNLQPARVQAEIPLSTAEQPSVTAVLRSGVNSELTRHRVTVTGSATQGSRRIALTRIFDLQLQAAFNPSADPARLEVPCGGTARVKLRANRLEPFTGEITVMPARVAGLTLPESVMIPDGQESVEVDLSVAADAQPGSLSVACPGMARIGGFLEQVGGTNLEVVVVPSAAAGADTATPSAGEQAAETQGGTP